MANRLLVVATLGTRLNRPRFRFGFERDAILLTDARETVQGRVGGNDCSLYAVSGLLEECGLASKATIPRAKTTLEDAGAIETTQIAQEVGRPRQRLHLADEEVGEDYPDVATVINAVQ